MSVLNIVAVLAMWFAIEIAWIPVRGFCIGAYVGWTLPPHEARRELARLSREGRL